MENNSFFSFPMCHYFYLKKKNINTSPENESTATMQPSPIIPPSPTLSPACLQTWYDTHLYAYLGVHGPIKDLSIADPDDRGGRLGVVSMAGQIEWVTRP